jgi:hypothetical protein
MQSGGSRWRKWLRDWLLGEPPDCDPAPRQTQDVWDDTAEELLEQTKLSAGQEDARTQSLIGRAGVLLGFCGAAIALSAATGKELLTQSAELGEPARDIAAYSLVVGLVLVSAAGVMALSALHPKRGKTLSVEELKAWSKPEAFKTSRFEYRRSLQWSLADSVDKERPHNHKRGRALRLGSWLLALGIVCLAPTALVFALDAADGPECKAKQAGTTAGLVQGSGEWPPPVTCPKQDGIFTDNAPGRERSSEPADASTH